MEPTIDDYMQWLTTSHDPEVRRNAAWVLGRQRDERILAPLLAAATDSNADVRLRVLEALGNLKNAQAVPTLINALSDANETPNVRAQAAESLGNLRDARAITPLIDALQADDGEVRGHAAEALGKLQAEAARDALLDMFLNDEYDLAYYCAGESLAAIGGTATVEGLLQGLNTHSDDTGIIVEIIELLAEIGDTSAHERVVALQNHADADVRTIARWASEQLSD